MKQIKSPSAVAMSTNYCEKLIYTLDRVRVKPINEICKLIRIQDSSTTSDTICTMCASHNGLV